MSIAQNPCDISPAEVIHTVAFYQCDFNPEVQAELNHLLEENGYGPENVRSWREQFLTINETKCRCKNCGEEVLIDNLIEKLSDLYENYSSIRAMEKMTDIELTELFALNNIPNENNKAIYLKSLFVLRKLTEDDLKSWRLNNCPKCGNKQLIRYSTPKSETSYEKTAAKSALAPKSLTESELEQYTDTSLLEALAF